MTDESFTNEMRYAVPRTRFIENLSRVHRLPGIIELRPAVLEAIQNARQLYENSFESLLWKSLQERGQTIDNIAREVNRRINEENCLRHQQTQVTSDMVTSIESDQDWYPHLSRQLLRVLIDNNPNLSPAEKTHARGNFEQYSAEVWEGLEQDAIKNAIATRSPIRISGSYPFGHLVHTLRTKYGVLRPKAMAESSERLSENELSTLLSQTETVTKVPRITPAFLTSLTYHNIDLNAQQFNKENRNILRHALVKALVPPPAEQERNALENADFLSPHIYEGAYRGADNMRFAWFDLERITGAAGHNYVDGRFEPWTLYYLTEVFSFPLPHKACAQVMSDTYNTSGISSQLELQALKACERFRAEVIARRRWNSR